MASPTLSRPARLGERLSSPERITLATLAVLCIVLLAVTALIGLLDEDTAQSIIDDPSEGGSQNFPPYIGALSYLGVIGWTVGAALAVLAASVAGVLTGTGRFLLWAGALTTVLGLDDLFRLHEELGFVVPGGEKLAMASYGLAGAALVWYCRDFVRAATPVVVLVAAGLLLGGSAVVDSVPLAIPKVSYVEEALKFAGILAWAAYLGITARRVCDRDGDSDVDVHGDVYFGA